MKKVSKNVTEMLLHNKYVLCKYDDRKIATLYYKLKWYLYVKWNNL